MDLLDDIIDDGAAKKGKGKFLPKKFRPAPKKSVANSTSSAQTVKTTDTTPSELSKPVLAEKPSEHSSEVATNDNGGLDKSVGENAEVCTELKAVGDSLPHTTTHMEGTVSPLEEVAPNVPNPETSEGGLASRELSPDVDPLTAGEPIVSFSDAPSHMDNRESEREEMDVMDSINTSTKYEQRTKKFKPKPKRRMQEEIGSQSTPPEIDLTQKDSTLIHHDDVSDLSGPQFTPNLPTEETSELPLNGESIDPMETTLSDSGIQLESVPKAPAKKLASRRAKTGQSKPQTTSDPSPHQQKASTSSHENGTGRSLRPRKGKTNLRGLVDEDEEEVLASRDFSEECPVSSALEDVNNTNEEPQVESESQTKKMKRKSKKPDDDKEKPAKKSKKAKEASDKDADPKPRKNPKPKKKFSHTTRRRRVSKDLLETPEGQYQHLPLRDLMLLAEHNEKQMKKEEAAAAAAAALAKRQSNGENSNRQNEDENITSEQRGEYNDEEEAPVARDGTIFNYQTHMDKTPRVRWSNQDTEKFYEAMRQFGTDLSMIQQLFPDRTRRQIKLKYKKEERQHPTRLGDAWTNPTADVCHFRTVVDRIKKRIAEEEQNSDREGSIDLTGDEEVDEEGPSNNADDEEAKDELVEEEVNETFEGGSTSMAADEMEDDSFLWSQYKSDA